MKRIINFFLLTIFSLMVVGCQQPGGEKEHEHEYVNGSCECGELHNCEYYKGQCECGKKEPSSGPVDQDNIPTPYTDQIKLTANYAGKSFVNDGIGEVTLANSTDGDTAIFKDNNRNITVRFNGINTPESTYKLEPWGVAASQFTKSKLESAVKIVLQTDTLKTNRFDSTGEYSSREVLREVDFEEGITHIGAYAFYNGSLTKCVFPTTLKSIGEYAFDGCSKLIEVFYSGTKKQWNQISFGKENSVLADVTVHCAEPENKPAGLIVGIVVAVVVVIAALVIVIKKRKNE